MNDCCIGVPFRSLRVGRRRAQAYLFMRQIDGSNIQVLPEGSIPSDSRLSALIGQRVSLEGRVRKGIFFANSDSIGRALGSTKRRFPHPEVSFEGDGDRVSTVTGTLSVRRNPEDHTSFQLVLATKLGSVALIDPNISPRTLLKHTDLLGRTVKLPGTRLGDTLTLSFGVFDRLRAELTGSH